MNIHTLLRRFAAELSALQVEVFTSSISHLTSYIVHAGSPVEAEERASTTATAVICQVCLSCCDETCRAEFVEAYTLRAFVEHVGIAGIGDGGRCTQQFVAVVATCCSAVVACRHQDVCQSTLQYHALTVVHHAVADRR